MAKPITSAASPYSVASHVALTNKKGDIFDQIAPDTKEDIFDQITQRGRVGEAGAAVARTFLDIGKGLTGTTLPALTKLGTPTTAPTTNILFDKATENILSAKQKMQPTRTGVEGWLINTLAGGGSQLAANIALGSVSLPAVAVNMFSTSRQNVLDEGGTELEANLTGLAEAALETWGVSRLIKFKSAGAGSFKSLVTNVRKKLLKQAGGDLKNIGTNALKSALVEGLEEASQSGASLAISTLPGGVDIPRKKDGSPDWGAMISQVGEEAAGGALLGTLVPGGMNVAQETTQMAQEVTPERRQRTIDIVRNSNLNEVQKARMLRALGIKEKVIPKGEIYYHGSAVAKDVFDGAEFFTDSPGDASAYAEMQALEKVVEENDELNEIVSDIMAEEDADSITDLDVDTIHNIIEANDINIKKAIGKGTVSKVHLKFDNPLNLTKYGSEVGSADYVGETWNELYEAGLLDEGPFESFDEEIQREIIDNYADKAIYKLFENEGVYDKAFKRGHDAIIFTDQAIKGKTKHKSVLVRDKSQITVYTNEEVSPKSLEIVDRLADELAQLEPKRKQLNKETKRRRAGQFAKQAKVLNEVKETASPEDTAKMAMGSGRGMLKSLVPEVSEKFSKDDKNTLYRLINDDVRISEAERKKLYNVMKAIFDDRVQPSRSEIKAFDKFFGTNIIEAGKRYAPKWQKAIRFTWDAFTKVPRAFVCSFDNSFAGVQAGLFAGSKHPITFIKDVTQGLKMLASEDYTNLVKAEIRTNPLYEQAIRDGLAIEGKEEYFQSDLAHRVPFVGWIPKVSDRTFSTTAHKLRLDYYNMAMEANQEMATNPAWRRKVADHINNITGSGRFPGVRTRVGRFLNEAANATLWSPKLYIGAGKTWTDMITKPGIRKMAAADLVRGLGVGFAILALAKLIFKDEVEIELNPQSSDAYRLKYGNTRINYWGQHQQMARLVAQLATGKTKSTATGRISDVKRLDIVKRYLRFKLNPAMSVPVDIATGTTALGERMRGEPEFIAEYVANHLAPLFLQDIVDAVRYQGWGTAMAIAPAAFHGVGAQTYEKSARVELSDLRDHYAHEAFGVDWDQLGPDYQQAIRGARPILDEYQRKANIEAEDFNYQSRLQSEQREAGRRVRKALPKNIQNIFEDLGVNTSISKRISSNWWLTDERSEYYEKEVVKLLKQSVPEIINQPEWKTLDRNIQLEYLQGVVDAAKEYVRGEIVTQANIEDYQRVQAGGLPE